MAVCSCSNRTVLIGEGVLFTILGLIAISLPVFSTLGIELFLGWLFLIGGGVQLYRTVKYHIEPYYGSLLTAILYLIFGILLLVYPVVGILSLTLILTFFFALDGIAKLYFAFQIRNRRRWGWFLISGLLSLLLAYLIGSGWPGTAFWAIGLLAGINLLFFGISLIAWACSIPKEDENKL